MQTSTEAAADFPLLFSEATPDLPPAPKPVNPDAREKTARRYKARRKLKKAKEAKAEAALPSDEREAERAEIREAIPAPRLKLEENAQTPELKLSRIGWPTDQAIADVKPVAELLTLVAGTLAEKLGGERYRFTEDRQAKLAAGVAPVLAKYLEGMSETPELALLAAVVAAYSGPLIEDALKLAGFKAQQEQSAAPAPAPMKEAA